MNTVLHRNLVTEGFALTDECMRRNKEM